MRKVLDNLAQLIDNGENVALYAATLQASQVINVLRKDYGVKPCCVIDSDKYRHGKQFLSVDITSLDKAVETWKDLKFFCASDWYNAAIIGNLLTKGISEDKIINYEPVEKYRSCYALENMCMIGEHLARFCCEFDVSPRASNSIASKMVEEFSELRRNTISNLRSGAQATPCDNCYKLQENYFFVNKRIRGLSIGEGGRCNFNCLYCVASKRGSWDLSGDDVDCLEFVKTMIEYEKEGLFSLDIAIGEITILPERKLFYALAEDRSTVVATNASVFDQQLERILANGLCTLNVSLDTGTKESFAKVKGADCFEKVIENLRRYRQAAGYSAFCLKYILLPGINTNHQDIAGFVAICKEFLPISVRISYDMYAPKTLDVPTLHAAQELYSQLDRLGIVIQFDFIAQEDIKKIRSGMRCP